MTAGLLLIGGVPRTVLATNSMNFLGLDPIFRGHVRFARRALRARYLNRNRSECSNRTMS